MNVYNSELQDADGCAAPQVTDLELAVLTAIDHNDFNDGHILASIWTNCLEQSMPASGPKGAAVGAVVASLVKKGLVGVDNSSRSKRDHTLWMTKAGAKVYASAVGVHNVRCRSQLDEILA